MLTTQGWKEPYLPGQNFMYLNILHLFDFFVSYLSISHFININALGQRIYAVAYILIHTHTNFNPNILSLSMGVSSKLSFLIVYCDLLWVPRMKLLISQALCNQIVWNFDLWCNRLGMDLYQNLIENDNYSYLRLRVRFPKMDFFLWISLDLKQEKAYFA